MKIANEYWSKLVLTARRTVRKPHGRCAGAADDTDLIPARPKPMPTSGCRNSRGSWCQALPPTCPHLPRILTSDNRPQCEPSPEMIMSRLLQKSARQESSCSAPASALRCPSPVAARARNARKPITNTARTISRKRIMPKPASSSGTLSSVKPICCRHGRPSPEIDEQEQNLAGASRDAAPDHRTCTKRSRGHDQAGADLSVWAAAMCSTRP